MNFHENEISLKRNYEVLRQQVYQSEKSIGTHLLSKTWKSSIPILGAVFNNKDSRSTWASKMTVQMSDSIMIFYGNSSSVSFCWREWIARFSVVVCHNWTYFSINYEDFWKKNKQWTTHNLHDEKSFIQVVNTNGLFCMGDNDYFKEMSIENLKARKPMWFLKLDFFKLDFIPPESMQFCVWCVQNEQ